MARDPYEVVLTPYVTEKSMDLMIREYRFRGRGRERKPARLNSLEFIVHRRANKKEIKFAVERLFEVKVERVNTFIAKDGKHAIVKLHKDYSAEELGTRIGIF